MSGNSITVISIWRVRCGGRTENSNDCAALKNDCISSTQKWVYTHSLRRQQINPVLQFVAPSIPNSFFISSCLQLKNTEIQFIRYIIHLCLWKQSKNLLTFVPYKYLITQHLSDCTKIVPCRQKLLKYKSRVPITNR